MRAANPALQRGSQLASEPPTPLGTKIEVRDDRFRIPDPLPVPEAAPERLVQTLTPCVERISKVNAICIRKIAVQFRLDEPQHIGDPGDVAVSQKLPECALHRNGHHLKRGQQPHEAGSVRDSGIGRLQHCVRVRLRKRSLKEAVLRVSDILRCGERHFIETPSGSADAFCLSGDTGVMKSIRTPGHLRSLRKPVPGQGGAGPAVRSPAAAPASHGR